MPPLIHPSLFVPPLAVTELSKDFLDQVAFQATGILIVLGTLSGIWIAVVALGQVLRLFSGSGVKAPSQAQADRAASMGALPEATPPEVADPRVIAAISAAVHTALRGRARIVSIVPQAAHSQVWSHEGRRDIYQSHRVR